MQTITDIGTLIVRTPGTCGGRPRIATTRFSVEQIAVLHKQGLTAAEIVKEFDFLNLAQVYAALAYYHANTEEIETYLAEEEAEYDRLVVEQAIN
ncbi:DUF433 domain-containing protein [Kovacikia minuta CCNUW1]|uniref:DUF433 domain-containing protein n=1 Tax=Kovacikia minuta TaxID=2931930 RepID=UPI001CCE4D5B|nr:DUF433 domain-containing protein [Kovacikia minuta]UBF28057.1 DUF433 domain-containing protein [Kovacikia minuta CCNUW1]